MRFAICTAAYPEAPGFVADFFTGVARASRDRPETVLIAAVEFGFDEFDGLVREHGAGVPVRTDHAPAPTTAAGLRRRMLDAAAASDADIVVFADFDDRLLPDALRLHADALDEADISYGDMVLIDGAGQPLDSNFFDGAAIPKDVGGPAAIAERNFLGFGNTAVRRAALARAALSMPDDAMPADWWLFTMLLSGGLKGRRTDAPVALYRSHGASTLGAAPATTLTVLRRRAAMALNHHRQLDARVDVSAACRAVERLVDYIDRDHRAWSMLSPVLVDCPGVWFEDVARASRAVAKIMTTIH